MEYNKFIDHTNLKQDATREEIKKLCEEAISYDFMSVCVNPDFVKFASDLLLDSEVKVCTVIGFPLGASQQGLKYLKQKIIFIWFCLAKKAISCLIKYHATNKKPRKNSPKD